MKQNRQWMFIVLTFVVALDLMILPIPNNWQWIRPEWLTLVVIYWIFTRPQLVGIATAWGAGLVLDSLYGGVLGQYALSLMMVAFFARFLRYRIKFAPIWQRWLMIFALLGVEGFVLFMVQWVIGDPAKALYYWAPMLSSLIAWPWIRRLMNFYERKVFA